MRTCPRTQAATGVRTHARTHFSYCVVHAPGGSAHANARARKHVRVLYLGRALLGHNGGQVRHGAIRALDRARQWLLPLGLARKRTLDLLLLPRLEQHFLTRVFHDAVANLQLLHLAHRLLELLVLDRVRRRIGRICSAGTRNDAPMAHRHDRQRRRVLSPGAPGGRGYRWRRACTHTDVLDHVGRLFPLFYGGIRLLLVEHVLEERRVLGHTLDRLKRQGASGEGGELPRGAGEQEPGCSPGYVQVRRLPAVRV